MVLPSSFSFMFALAGELGWLHPWEGDQAAATERSAAYEDERHWCGKHQRHVSTEDPWDSYGGSLEPRKEKVNPMTPIACAWCKAHSNIILGI